MSFFEQAACLNNEGVTALLEGDDTSAIDAMTKSIKKMKKELSKPGTELRAFKSDISSDAADLVMDTVEIPGVNSSETALFNQAINIPCQGEQTDLDVHVYSAAVIFNLALAHHHAAITSDAGYLPKAEKLYAMVLKLLDDAALHLRTAVVIKLATINNLSQIRFENGDFELAREGLSHLSNFVRQTNNALLEEPEVQGLLMNVLLLKVPRMAPAA
jgi:hypothetical protein